MVLPARVVFVHRRSEYEELLDRHATYGQAEFFLRSRRRAIEDVVARHEAIEAALHLVSTSLPADVRQALKNYKAGDIVSLRIYNTQAKNRRIERIRLGSD